MSDPGSLRVLLVVAGSSSVEEPARQVADLLRRLPAEGCEVALACPSGGDLPTIAAAAGAQVFEADIASGYSPTRSGDLRPALDAFAPDIVHALGARASVLARLADSRARERVVYTLHDVHMDPAGSRARRAAQLRVERRLRSRTAAWICECGSDLDRAEHLKILRRIQSHVVHNGVELPAMPTQATGSSRSSGELFRQELGLPDEAPLVLAIGELDEQHDHRTLLNAWASARTAAPSAALAIVGSGELEGRLRERALALSLGDSLRLVPARSDTASLYRAADVFVLSSRWEGLPYVIVDAMAHGLAVVSTAVDGIPEAVINEDTGLLAPTHDAGLLASAMRQLLGDPVLRAAMGQAGRERIERHFSLDEMVEGVIRVYREVVSAGTMKRDG